jgi:hypothetical protein
MIHLEVPGPIQYIGASDMKKSVSLVLLLLFWFSPALAEVFVDTAWIRMYSKPWIGTDRAFDIAVDASGRVYVTGVSQTHAG